VEHLQTWLKKSSQLQSELLIQPIDLTFEILRKSLDLTPTVLAST
jgi:hypothetical protein